MIYVIWMKWIKIWCIITCISSKVSSVVLLEALSNLWVPPCLLPPYWMPYWWDCFGLHPQWSFWSLLPLPHYPWQRSGCSWPGKPLQKWGFHQWALRYPGHSCNRLGRLPPEHQSLWSPAAIWSNSRRYSCHSGWSTGKSHGNLYS